VGGKTLKIRKCFRDKIDGCAQAVTVILDLHSWESVCQQRALSVTELYVCTTKLCQKFLLNVYLQKVV